MTHTLHRGTRPLLVSIPHMGTAIPEDLRGHYAPRALEVEDTDWHLDRLYAFARALGASVLQPTFSRYVVDLNRPPDDTPMYPGAASSRAMRSTATASCSRPRRRSAGAPRSGSRTTRPCRTNSHA